MITDFFSLTLGNLLMMKKSTFLIATLAIPVAIFLFLKIFGENSYEVPVLFEDGIPECLQTSSPHKVPDIANYGATIKDSGKDGFQVFGFLDNSTPKLTRKYLVEVIRMQDAFYEVGAPHFVLLSDGDLIEIGSLESLSEEMGMDLKNTSFVHMDSDSLLEFLNCGIALIDDENDPKTNLVLVDPDRRIRGIYNSMEVEETDKLILELRILKQSS